MQRSSSLCTLDRDVSCLWRLVTAYKYSILALLQYCVTAKDLVTWVGNIGLPLGGIVIQHIPATERPLHAISESFLSSCSAINIINNGALREGGGGLFGGFRVELRCITVQQSDKDQTRYHVRYSFVSATHL